MPCKASINLTTSLFSNANVRNVPTAVPLNSWLKVSNGALAIFAYFSQNLFKTEEPLITSWSINSLQSLFARKIVSNYGKAEKSSTYLSHCCNL